MRTPLGVGVLVLLSSIVLVACTSSPSADSGGGAAGYEADCAICALGKTGSSVWCDDCDAGYVAGEQVTCRDCFSATKGGPPCPTCVAK